LRQKEDVMRKFELVIVGGGLASARAIRAYREAGGEGGIALLSSDAVLPYHRPPLSKGYLRDETDAAPFVEDEAFYSDHDVEIFLGTTVSTVRLGAHSLTTERGRRYDYDKLLIATGARPRRLNVSGASLDGVFTLRSLADSGAIRDAAHRARRAVVVGAGFIGMEVAASLRRVGLDVTLIHLGVSLFDQLGSRELGDQLASMYREEGVDLLLEEEVRAFGGDGRLGYVETTSGIRVEADLAVVGVGVLPNIELLTSSGLALDNGVVVNERFETEVPGVYAVGDVANFFDPSTDATGGSSTGRTPTTRARRSARSSRAPGAGTTSSRRSSARSSGQRSRSSATSAAPTSRQPRVRLSASSWPATASRDASSARSRSVKARSSRRWSKT
jgi:NADPH-dependent 2,4-dienoyl-CoA reductase/sulfur reductase-like enzyme